MALLGKTSSVSKYPGYSCIRPTYKDVICFDTISPENSFAEFHFRRLLREMAALHSLLQPVEPYTSVPLSSSVAQTF